MLAIAQLILRSELEYSLLSLGKIKENILEAPLIMKEAPLLLSSLSVQYQ